MYIKLSFWEQSAKTPEWGGMMVGLTRLPIIILKRDCNIKPNRFIQSDVETNNSHLPSYKKYDYYIDCKHMSEIEMKKVVNDFNKANSNDLPYFVVANKRQTHHSQNPILKQMQAIMFAIRPPKIAGFLRYFKKPFAKKEAAEKLSLKLRR